MGALPADHPCLPYRPYDLIEELEKRGLFAKRGEIHTPPVTFLQSVPDYIESIHSRNGFSRDRMPPAGAAAFDAEVARLVSPWTKDGLLELQITGRVVWGLPSPQ